MDLLNLSKLSSNEILEGSFGIEWESLRAKGDGELSLTPHPEIFGDKLTNPLITTDFSESQIEIITPTFNTIDKAFDMFSILSDLVNSSLPEDEYLWFQSIPCILPYWDKIPIAQYPKEGKESQKYREDLAKKYGVKKQMISGVHFNFSFTDEFLEKFHAIENPDLSFKEFKNSVYLKIARNYLRYCWLIIYLTGCSIGSHKTFSNDCIHLMDAQDDYGSYYSTRGPSFRNASCGYKNLKELYPSYDSVDEFTSDIEGFIENGDLSEAKELYTQIRLKPKNPKDLLNSLKNDGIQYIEIRTLDINPFYKCGLVKHDMKFLHIFLIYMMIKDESDYADWQREAKINEENTAESAYVESMRLLRDGNEVTLKSWAAEIINEMYGMCEVLGFDEFNTLDLMLDRISNPDLTYGKNLLKLIEEKGYINTHIELSKNNKMTSIHNLKNIDFDECEELKEYADIALGGGKNGIYKAD
ncbi:glutamate--cysteine ligase [Methanobrevibacter sp.]